MKRLTDTLEAFLELGSLVTARTSHNDSIQYILHILFQLLVDVILVHYREVTQMDTLGCICIVGS